MKMNKGDLNWNTLSGVAIDKKLGKLLNTVVAEVKTYAEDQIDHIRKLSDIGIALSVEKDINILFEMIVKEAKSLCNADAGTLYIVDESRRNLKFVIVQNDTLKVKAGLLSDASLKLSDVPLYKDNLPNHSNVSSHVALTGERLNISDVYQADKINEFRSLDFSGPRKYDEKTGYLTRSMLVIPMKNYENRIIGVLQLLNAQDRESQEIIAFPPEDENLIASLASQAAVALTNVQLIKELKDLFYSFIKSIAMAIDEKSPYTGGHISRVVDLTNRITSKINAANTGVYRNVFLNKEEKEALLMAAWMHDVGKITTPEHIVDKSTKLETIFDRIELIALRFAVMEEKIKNNCLQRKLGLMENNRVDETAMKALEADCSNQIQEIWKDFEVIKKSNNAGEFTSDDILAKIKKIAGKTYQFKGKTRPVLSRDEVKHLSVRKGTLTEQERKIIENHSKMTYMITSQLPFPRHLSHVPEYASQHHEKLEGSGYPNGLSEKDLSLQSRILAVADIFDALTAGDRPYKKAMPLSRAIKILGLMKDDCHIDPDIVDLFLETQVHLEYARDHLSPDQVDV